MEKKLTSALFVLLMAATALPACSGENDSSDAGDGDGDALGTGDGDAAIPGGDGDATATGGNGTDGTGTGGDTASGTGGAPTGDPSCPMMCEVTETVQVPVEGGGPMCTAEEWVAGMGYVGGSVVAYEGAEYTANYWTDISPAIGSSSELGSPWSVGVPCPGSDDATEEQTITKMVCCESQPTEPPPQTQTCPLDSILGEAGFNEWFRARRDPFYTYANLCVAIESFPGFASSGDDAQNRREVAAFFANVARETGELDYIEQFPETRGNTGNYYGRGPIQLTWDYNYESAGDAIGEDLISNPGLVATDGVITWEVALWFWMDADGAGKGTCHGAILDGDFGQTINIINGGLECFAGNEAATQRINYYRSFCEKLGVDPGNQLECW